LAIRETSPEANKAGRPQAFPPPDYILLFGIFRQGIAIGGNVIPEADLAAPLAVTVFCAGGLPSSEPRDAFHISIAATNGIEYLVTWNFKHIANATRRGVIEQTCREFGCEPPRICTPDELLGA